MNQQSPNVTGKNSKYAKKKQAMKSGSYTGTSPFYSSNPEWQYLFPLSHYPHLRKYNLPHQPPQTRRKNDTNNTRTEN